MTQTVPVTGVAQVGRDRVRVMTGLTTHAGGPYLCGPALTCACAPEDNLAMHAALCQAQPGMIPRRLFAAGLETSKQGLAAMRHAMANVVELEVLPDLNFLLPSILAIAKIATMVGLLGTVISMINTFIAIQQAKGGIADQAGAIGLALFATALGLVTAIPLVFAHVLLKSWVGRMELRMKSAAHRLLFLLQNVKLPPAKPAAAPADKGSAALRQAPVI